MSNCDSLVEWSFIRSWVYVKDTRNKLEHSLFSVIFMCLCVPVRPLKVDCLRCIHRADELGWDGIGVIHLTVTRLKLQGGERRKWLSSCCVSLACCNGFNRWTCVVFLEEVGLTRTVCPRCAQFCCSHKGLLYAVKVWECVYAGRYNYCTPAQSLLWCCEYRIVCRWLCVFLGKNGFL